MIDVNPNSRKNKFRAARIRELKNIIADYVHVNGACRLLDIGGTEKFWKIWLPVIDEPYLDVTCVNISDSHGLDPESNVRVQKGDATNLIDFKDNEFDVVFSNSVIEHVGMWPEMTLFASEARRVARSYLIQTPYFWFPIEPHARTPLIHWLPDSLQYRILLRRRCGFWKRAQSVDEAMRQIQSARMLDRRQMATLFPDAEIHSERFLGFTKSLIARCHWQVVGKPQIFKN